MRQFMMLEYWLDDNRQPCVNKFTGTYDEVMARVKDEHYSEGICLAFTIIPADDDGVFGDTTLIERAILS